MNSYTEVCKQILDRENKDVIFKVNTDEICVITNTTMEPLFDDYMKFYESGYNVKYYNLDTYKQSSAKKAVVIISLSDLLEMIYYNIYILLNEELTERLRQMNKYLEELIKKIASSFDEVLFYNFAYDIYEDLPETVQSWNSVVAYANEIISRASYSCMNLTIEDINQIISSIGYNNFYSMTKKYSYNILYSIKGFDKLASRTTLWLKQRKSKKCIVLDCDGVLWGGIYAEDGLSNIVLSRTGIGKIYREFQRELLKLYSIGVILCLCSKNKEEDIWYVFNNHPDMLLTKENICSYRINYNNKADNIRDIINELNIHLDSVVFVDDNLFEINLVKMILPEVTTIYFNSIAISKDITEFCRKSFFKSWKINRTSGNRTQLYKERKRREEMYERCTNTEKLNDLLHLKVELYSAKEMDLPRIVELSNRCNQFNLSARRYNITELNLRMKSNNYDIICLRANDDFGSYGMVCCSIVQYVTSQAIIEAFFLSCRAFGHDFESKMIQNIIERANLKGITEIKGIYVKTKKNAQNELFYISQDIQIIN